MVDQASGGQVALGGSTNLIFRSNLINNGNVTTIDPRFQATGGTIRSFQAHGFELNDGLINMSIHHNTINNNTGFSIIANRSPSQYCAPSQWSGPKGGCPGVDCKTCGAFCPSSYGPNAKPWPGPADTSVSYADNLMCGNVINGSTGAAINYDKARLLCGNPYACNLSTAPWLKDKGAGCFGTGGGETCDCNEPLRPRGQISALPATCVPTTMAAAAATHSHSGNTNTVVTAVGGCTTVASWVSLDTSPGKVHVVVLNEATGAPASATAYHGDLVGANGTVAVQLGDASQGGLASVRLQLWMDDWGLLDESFATVMLAAVPPAGRQRARLSS